VADPVPKRACVVIVDSVRIEGLRCVFKVVKSLKKEPNTLDLKIHNLSERTRSAVQKKGVPVIVSAGYDDRGAIIFSGDARTADHVRDNTDWVTHVQCGDGERAYQFARVSKSFKPGTPVADVVRATARELGLGTGNLDTALAEGGFRGGLTQFASGYSAKGRAALELDRLFRTVGLTWSVQDGHLQVLRGTKPVLGKAVLLTPNTGLIGSPDHGAPDTKGGPSILKVKALLNPQFICGGQVQVESDSVKGLFRIEKLEHEGDTEAGNWYSMLELKPA
jgi:hypothetical protein